MQPVRLPVRAVVVLLSLVGLVACTSGTPGPSASAPRSAASAPTDTTDSSATATSGSASGSSGSSGRANWPTYHGSADRAGYAADMPAVRGHLRLVNSIKLDAAVYASPIVVDGLTVVATENDTVYAFDSSYRVVWKRHLRTPAPGSQLPCGNIDPLGITGTPVYDATSGLVYLAAEYGGPPRHEIVAIGLHDGRVHWRHSLDLPGVETKAMQERGALAVAGNRVWVPFGGLTGDCGGYKGRLIGYSLDGRGAPISYTVPTEREAGMWTPPGAAVDDGNLLVAVGNGASVVGDRYDHSDSVLRISSSTGKLVDSFSPSTWPTDNAHDKDLGSMGPIVIGKWVVTAGKSGNGYVLQRTHLGGVGGQVSKGPLCSAYGGAAVSGDVAYVPCDDGVRAVRIDADGTMHVRWHADSAIAGSPVIGGGRVWSVDATNGVLHALDPATGRSREQAGIGTTSRFATPAISGRDVLVPTLSGLAVVRTS